MRSLFVFILSATILQATASDNDIPLTFVEASTIFLQRLTPRLDAEGQTPVRNLMTELDNESTTLTAAVREGLQSIKILVNDYETENFLKEQLFSICDQFLEKNNSSQLYWMMCPRIGLQGSTQKITSKPGEHKFRLIPKSDEKSALLSKRIDKK